MAPANPRAAVGSRASSAPAPIAPAPPPRAGGRPGPARRRPAGAAPAPAPRPPPPRHNPPGPPADAGQDRDVLFPVRALVRRRLADDAGAALELPKLLARLRVDR